ncbi:MAG: Uma2 family endonuclease [Acidobacteria bacterium]|nr:Uma2 family endonuclease [Acidobacteriota bacterium]
MASVPKPLDYAAYLKTPETKRRFDIVDGEFQFMSPAPDTIHQQTVLEVCDYLKRHVERYDLGQVFVSPVDVIISKTPMRTRQPDVLYVSRSRQHLVQAQIEGGPDLVVEILSPGNTPKRVQEKLRDYAAIGVLEAWLLDRKQRVIGVWRPVQGVFQQTALYHPGQRVRSNVLPRLRLPVDRVFPR